MHWGPEDFGKVSEGIRSDMTEEHDAKPSTKIVDRRRFDLEGEEKNGAAGDGSDDATVSSPNREERAHVAAGKPSEADQTRAEPVGSSYQSEGPEVNFSSFMISLATQALMQLGQIKPPPGVDMPVDRASAKQTIDILSMLEKKTKGNLDEEEARLVEEILHNLRLSYVKSA